MKAIPIPTTLAAMLAVVLAASAELVSLLSAGTAQTLGAIECRLKREADKCRRQCEGERQPA